jgi:ribose 5-phosphate isomerase B
MAPTIVDSKPTEATMKISISADSLLGIAGHLAEWVRERGHVVRLHGALDPAANAQWAWASAAAATDVAEGRADQAIVCCFTGTGATIAASKIPGIRAALCTDAFTAKGARLYNDANVLGISLRLASDTVMQEMLDAWFATRPEQAQALNIDYVNGLDRR